MRQFGWLVTCVCSAACASEQPVSADVPVARSIEYVSGSGVIGIYGNTLPDPLVVKVKDQFGHGFPGAVVDFAVNGTVMLDLYSVTTSASGKAQVRFSFGLRAGVDTVTATVAGVPGNVLFIETANPGIAASLTVATGNNQSGPSGAPLAADMVVQVTDNAGNPTPNAEIVWTAARGTPAFTRNSTGADGRATLRFTPAVGANAVNVSVDRTSLTTAFSATGN